MTYLDDHPMLAAQLEPIARAAASRFCQTSSERDDAVQVARIAIWEASARIDPSADESRARAFLFVAARRQVMRSVVRFRAPVSGVQHDPHVAWGTSASDAELTHAEASEPTPEEAVARARDRRALRAILSALADESGGRALTAVLLDEATVGEVAEANGVSPRVVRQAVRAFVDRLRTSRDLARLLR